MKLSPTGIASAITGLSGLLVSPFAHILIKWTGEVNMVTLGVMATGLKLILYSLIT